MGAEHLPEVVAAFAAGVMLTTGAFVILFIRQEREHEAALKALTVPERSAAPPAADDDRTEPEPEPAVMRARRKADG